MAMWNLVVESVTWEMHSGVPHVPTLDNPHLKKEIKLNSRMQMSSKLMLKGKMYKLRTLEEG